MDGLAFRSDGVRRVCVTDDCWAYEEVDCVAEPDCDDVREEEGEVHHDGSGDGRHTETRPMSYMTIMTVWQV